MSLSPDVTDVKIRPRASETKALANSLGKLSSSPRNHVKMKGRTDSTQLSIDLHTHTHKHTYTHKMKFEENMRKI